MKVTLLGFTIPDELLLSINRNDSAIASQTHRFAWGVVRSLQDAGVQVDLLSSAPVSDYPRNPRWWWRGSEFREHGTDGYLMPFVNALILKHLTRSVSAWIYGRRRLERSKPDWILVHGVHSPFLWFAVGVAERIKARTCVLLTDPPGVVRAEDNRVRRALKRLDIALTKAALRRADAVVVLARPLAEDFAPGVRALVMEGIFDTASWNAEVQRPNGVSSERTGDTFVVTYAGGLSEAYGVMDLVTAVRSSIDQRLRLKLYGRGHLEAWIREIARKDERITPASLVDPSELGRIYAESDALVQPRPVAQAFVPYSFPSKLIEYLASGTPVVSTRLPSIPEDYHPYVLWADDGPDGLRTAIEDLLARNAETRSRLGAGAACFIAETRSPKAQGARLRTFLEEASFSG